MPVPTVTKNLRKILLPLQTRVMLQDTNKTSELAAGGSERPVRSAFSSARSRSRLVNRVRPMPHRETKPALYCSVVIEKSHSKSVRQIIRAQSPSSEGSSVVSERGAQATRPGVFCAGAGTSARSRSRLGFSIRKGPARKLPGKFATHFQSQLPAPVKALAMRGWRSLPAWPATSRTSPATR